MIIRLLYKTSSLLVILVLSANIAFGCTEIGRKFDGQWYSGRNFDWNEGQAYVVINPAQAKRKALSIDKKYQPLEWQSKYASITIDMAWKDRPNYAAVVDGMNEKGLSASVLELDEAEYPALNKGSKALGAAMLVQYVLDNFDSVKSAIAAIKTLPVVPTIYKGKTTPLHFVLNDSAESTAVVEYIKGKLHIYSGKKLPLHVLTNTPYSEALKEWQLLAYKPLEQRWPAGFGSMSRFIKAADFLQQSLKANESGQAISLMFVGLSGAAQPPGSEWPTEWQVVRNNTEKTYCVRTMRNQRLDCFDLKKLKMNSHYFVI